eukprot:7352905-Prymnesium_polylepis.1
MSRAFTYPLDGFVRVTSPPTAGAISSRWVLVDESSPAAATHAAPERVGYLGGHRGPLMEAMLGHERAVSSSGAGSDDNASAVSVTFSDTSAG